MSPTILPPPIPLLGRLVVMPPPEILGFWNSLDQELVVLNNPGLVGLDGEGHHLHHLEDFDRPLLNSQGQHSRFAHTLRLFDHVCFFVFHHCNPEGM